MQPLEHPGTYKLSCGDCQKVYYGISTRQINTRFKEHIQNKNNNSKIGTHLIHQKHTTDIGNLELLRKEDNYFKLLLYEQYYLNRAYKEDADIILNDYLTINHTHYFMDFHPFK